jgi:hypothetical protein
MRYARDFEIKRDMGTLETPMTAAYNKVGDGFNEKVQTILEDPVLEGELLSLYRSLESVRRKLAGRTLELQPSNKVATLSDLKALMVLILP